MIRTTFALAGILLFAAGLAGCAAKQQAASSPYPYLKDGQPVIYSLRTRNQSLIVTKGPDGPLYRMTDSSGRTVLAPSTLAQVRETDLALYRWINSAMAAESYDAVR